MLVINAKLRQDQGKGASRRMRMKNKLPAIVYGGFKSPIAIELDHDVVLNIQKKEGFYRDHISLIIEGQESEVKVQAVQRHPFKPKLTHIDFVRV
ncbi:50S ribosomal protein L25 [Sodalis endosymbiont of Henestaris halophilus]|uniref:50S ribosomal protein L25 n=1 Tax=Sodalis endosymbiont of Henestaris halophilus TaxID=1929246 RepID=UPI000BBF8BEE|nr:50S ribosomal protein L25 [Sodalis endosymbiont of Henestaris halophilus]SNC58335.1 50S ribosomal protein L25 [Sodalis endosymbiont of Henestaris halophilus]